MDAALIGAGAVTEDRTTDDSPKTGQLEDRTEDSSRSRRQDSPFSEISYKLSGAFPMQLRPGRADASSMTSARAILVPPESPATYHCVSR